MMPIDVDLDGIFNSSYDYDQDYEYKDESESSGSKAVFILVVYSAELVLGLLGNGLLLAVLAQKRRSWSISDTFILHLSVADLLLLATLPFWAAQAGQQRGWCLGVTLCKISGAVFNINFYCGILLLGCICVDLYLSIIHDTHLYSQTKPMFAHISCLSVWLISLLLTIPDWIFLVLSKNSAQEKILCAHNYSDSLLVSRLVHHTPGFLLPAAVLIICCSCILLKLQRISKGLQKQRAVMVILPLVAVFFLCWMPYNITLIVDTISSSSKKLDNGSNQSPADSLKTALMVTSILGCLHACLRPLLYFGLCGSFRKQTLAMLRCTTVERESALPWELGVGEKALPDQGQVEEELKQMRTEDHQV